MIDFENDENHASRKSASKIDATLPSEKPVTHVFGDLSSSLSPSVHTLQSVGQQSTTARKSSPIRAFLTPPLMRKRKVPTTKHLYHDVEDGSNSRLSTHNTVGNVLPSCRSKSFGFLSLLKVNWCPRRPCVFFSVSFHMFHWYSSLFYAYLDPFLKSQVN